MRRSIVSSQDISAGSYITDNMLTFKRPAKGLAPRYFEEVLGKKARKDIQADSHIKWTDLED
jgi:sialic acid synthase SpsE